MAEYCTEEITVTVITAEVPVQRPRSDVGVVGGQLHPLQAEVVHRPAACHREQEGNLVGVGGVQQRQTGRARQGRREVLQDQAVVGRARAALPGRLEIMNVDLSGLPTCSLMPGRGRS